MKKKMRVGKATDGLMGGKSKKPRHYIEIDDENGEVVVSKIMTHDQANPKHVNRLNNNFRKRIKNFSRNSVVDKTLYIEKEDKTPIKQKEINFEESNFEFNEEQSRSIRRFIFSSEVNRKRYYKWKKRHKKRSK